MTIEIPDEQWNLYLEAICFVGTRNMNIMPTAKRLEWQSSLIERLLQNTEPNPTEEGGENI